MKANMLIACLATVDDRQTFYECKAIPSERWNGWAEPYFTLETIKKIIEDADYKIIKETDVAIHINEDFGDPECPLAYWTDNGWQISGWVWEIVSSDTKQPILRDGTVYDPHFTEVYNALQGLEEMGGPEGQQYVDVMNRIIAECQKRIEVCKSGVLTGKPF